MKIWADADSLPRAVREFILRRQGSSFVPGETIELRFVASRPVPGLEPPLLLEVQPGPDAADSAILEGAAPGDLVITRDVVFAEKALLSGLACINDRGDIFDAASVSERRSLRDAAAELRKLGLAPDSPRGSGRSAAELKRFADALEKTLVALKKKKTQSRG
ncbi:MAG TPA: DUF188 domain-containing protein [Rectinemataceae bacterium]